MLKQWIPAAKPDKEELDKRLDVAQEELLRLQMQIKEHKLPVLVLIEGWGAAGKGSTIGGIIKNNRSQILQGGFHVRTDGGREAEALPVSVFCENSGSRQVRIPGFRLDG